MEELLNMFEKLIYDIVDEEDATTRKIMAMSLMASARLGMYELNKKINTEEEKGEFDNDLN